MRTPDGLARGLDDLDGLAPTLRVGPAHPEDGGPGDTVPIIAATLNSGGNDGGFRTESGEHIVFGKVSRPHGPDGDGERWDAVDVASTRNGFDNGDVRAVELVGGADVSDHDPLLPLGLDSHRYRCCGNGVVADVAEWIGARLMAVFAAERAA
jgi:hypothetical protein